MVRIFASGVQTLRVPAETKSGVALSEKADFHEIAIGLPSNLDSGETSPPGPLPIDGQGEEGVSQREWGGVRFPLEVRREAIALERRVLP